MNPINELGSLAGAFLCAVLFNFLYDPRKNIWLNQDLDETATLFHRQSRGPINLKYVYELGILLFHELKHRWATKSNVNTAASVERWRSSIRYRNEWSLAGWQSEDSIGRRSRIRYVNWNADWRYPVCQTANRAKHETAIIVSVVLPNLPQCHGTWTRSVPGFHNDSRLRLSITIDSLFIL